MPPIRTWGLTRQNYNAMLNQFNTLWQTLRTEMATDPAYAQLTPENDDMLRIMEARLKDLNDHLTAEGK
jgi:hypothetical protein